MHRPLHALVCGALLLAGTLSGIASTPAVPTFPNLQSDPLYSQWTYQNVRDITVDVSWNQVEFRRVLQDLTLMVRKAHPINAEINFRFSSSIPPAERQRRVSLQLKNAPVYQVLEKLSQQVGFTIKIHPDIVLIEPLPGK